MGNWQIESDMVKSRFFISGVASILHLPEATISGAFRVLRESGLMTSGARGVNAPDMTDLDAARMLIAMLVNDRPAYAERSVRDFGQLVCINFRPAGGAGLSGETLEEFKRMSAGFTLQDRGIPDRHTFEQGVAELIRMYGDDRDKDYWFHSQFEIPERGRFDPHTIVEVVPGDLGAFITMQGNIYSYDDPLIYPISGVQNDSIEIISEDLDIEEAYNAKMSRYSTAIKSSRSISTRQIVALALLIREGVAPLSRSLS
jgi:hypothetical protein